MFPIFRSILAVMVGMLASFFLILAGLKLSQTIYPPPPWLDMNKPESLVEAIKVTPNGAMALSLVAWAIGTFIGAGIAARVAPTWKVGHGMIIGVLLLLSAISNMAMLPFPIWMWVIGLAEFLPIAYLGAKLNASTIERKPPVEMEV